ncbi:MAG: uncharacterized protein JWO86_2510 [Myxococcaceae bacterium]|nr:uncharacterized protein [Myxococcaceae bacterium]
MQRMSVIEREKNALAAHRAALRGSAIPPPHDAPKGTFVHGFFLPFSLIVATIRDGQLRGPYLRLAFLRGLLVVLAGVIAIAGGNISADRKQSPPSTGVVVHHSKDKTKQSAPIHVNVPGLHVDIDPDKDQASVSVLGQPVPVQSIDDDTAPKAPPPPERTAEPSPPPHEDAKPVAPPSLARRAWTRLGTSWRWLLALLAFLSAAEGVVVFFSRRWDDWLSFHASRLVAIVPEDATPKTPGIAVDLRWLYRKMKRRFRGYVVFAAGLPALLPLRLIPTAGPYLFSIAATLWGWYWIGVFSAAKSAHAWADEERALSPAPIRTLNERVSGHFVFGPLRWYGRTWARLTRGVNPAATTFERSPTAFLGLALARVVLSLPGLYLLARPIVPVAAGRLCAEADPAERFSLPRILPAVVPPIGP